ncbi:MAG: PAS domain S-box protein [Candidatus Heimdallarchaeota archaeon]|nr:PAS domain S-box protein [Candidatus Heimdallarchaeota archaeon]
MNENHNSSNEPRDNELKDKVTLETESENIYHSMFKSSIDAMFITNTEGMIIDGNQALLDMSGYSREEILNINAIDLYDSPETRKQFLEDITRAKSVRNYEIKYRRKDGTVTTNLLTATQRISKSGEFLGFQGTIRDITQQKIMGKALKESQFQYQILFENSGSSMVIVEADTTVSLMNSQFEKVSGYSKEEVIGNSFLKFLPEIERERIIQYHQQRRIDPSSVPKVVELQLLTKSGERRDFVYTVALVPGTDKSLVSLMDVTIVKATEIALNESIENYRTLVGASPDAILKTDLDLNILMANQQSYVFLGFEKEEELIGRNILDFVSDDFGKEVALRTEEIKKEGRVINIDFDIPNLEGEVINLSASISVIYENEQPQAYIVQVRNVTSYKELETQLTEYTHSLEEMVEDKAAQLMDQERAVMLGRLAGSIGHDINNPLQYVLGNAELLGVLLQEGKADMSKLISLNERLIEGCYRIGDVSKRLRRVSRKGELTVFNIYDALETAITMTRGKWRYKCENLDISYIAQSPTMIKGVENDISHVFMNLLVNSSQAIEIEGKIKINVLTDENIDNVIIEFEDTGIGMSSDIMDKIGKESFTTKSIEEGTGLGLLWVYEIMQQHFSKISFESEVNKGTKFKLIFPIEKQKK